MKFHTIIYKYYKWWITVGKIFSFIFSIYEIITIMDYLFLLCHIFLNFIIYFNHVHHTFPFLTSSLSCWITARITSKFCYLWLFFQWFILFLFKFIEYIHFIYVCIPHSYLLPREVKRRSWIPGLALWIIVHSLMYDWNWTQVFC